MSVFATLANHWVPILLFLLMAIAAALMAALYALSNSVQQARREKQIRRAHQEETSLRAGAREMAIRVAAAAANEPGSPAASISVQEDVPPPASGGLEVASAYLRIPSWMKQRVAARLIAGELNDTFAAAFQYLSGRISAPSEHIPLYVMAGPAGSGKSTLLEQVKMPWRWKQNQRAFGSSTGVMWNFCEQGIVLELPGGLLSDREECVVAWGHIPRLLQRHRPQRPLDGIVLVLPADLLLSSLPEETIRREETLGALQEAIAHMAGTLDMRLPLYIVLSKCDLIPGFARFVEKLPAHKREHALGWGNPQAAAGEFDPALVEQAGHELRQTLLRLGAEAALCRAGSHPAASAAASAWLSWTELDHQLTGLFATLRLALAGLLASCHAAPPMLRGIYLCSDLGSDLGKGIQATGAGLTAMGSWPGHRQRRLGFVEPLMLQRIFPEWGLATPARPALAARHAWARGMQALALALLMGLGIGGSVQGLRLIRNRDQHVKPILRTLARDSAHAASPIHLLQAMVRGGGGPLRSWLLPASLFSGVDAELQRRMRQALEARVYPALAQQLQREAHQRARQWVAIAARPPHPDAAQSIARPDQLAEYAALQRFSYDWLQLQGAVDAYRGLAHPDHPPAPEEAQRWLTRLGAPPPAPLTASAPVYRAIVAARGPAGAAWPADQQQASEVMRVLVRRLFYRWYLGNDLVTDLRQLARVPRGAKGKRERARLSMRIRRELKDPLLTSVLQSDHSLIAPLYAVTLATIDRSGGRSGFLDPGLRAFVQSEADGDAQQAQVLVEQLRSPSGSALIALQDGHWRLTADAR